jgi:exonuclease SbcC
VAQCRLARDEALATESAVRDRLASVTARLAEVRALLGAGNRVREEYLRVRELAQVVSGSGSNTMRMRLETYVLAAYLEDVLAAANGRLAAMTGRRYTLVLDDGRQHRNVETGLGVTVLDAHTGEARQAASLSGGETFLASLALALGLAEVVSAQAGGVTLDTLFVDEGFGSLDAETLDVALAALEDLRAGGRTIGLISHVESMRERIPAKLAVTVLPSGDSAVEPAPALV